MELSNDKRNALFTFNKNHTSRYKTRVWFDYDLFFFNDKNNEFSRNVFLTKDNNVKLGDLGIARLKSDESTCELCSTYAGTPAYMSPEMKTLEAYSFKTDVW